MARIQVLDQGADFRWRLCGERVQAVLGLRLARRCLSEVEADLPCGGNFRELLEEVVRERAPVVYKMDYDRSIRPPARAEDDRPVTACGGLFPFRDARSERPYAVSDLLWIVRYR